jgi:rod shape determining protein RodA
MSTFTDPTLLRRKLIAINWWIVLAIIGLGTLGLAVLYSGAGGNIRPWALNQGVRFVVLLCIMLAIALSNLRGWLSLAYPIYFVILFLLMVVEATGKIGGGSQRWIDLGIINLQPSEFMKLAIVLALARYYADLPRVSVTTWSALWPALALIGVPFVLVMVQPDLGTALMIFFGGVTMLWLGGVRWWLFAGGAGSAAVFVPFAYNFLLRGYQRDRILIFMDPAKDPLGSGYHITQSKIAIGSGGFFGKGFLQGTQSHLKFLPEMQTDFIFAMMSEELGMVGGLAIIGLYGTIFAWGLWVSLTCRSLFGRMLAMGLSMTVFFYLAINLLMVMGLAPVVGIPLPLISYGGSAMMTVLMALGLIFCVSINRDEQIGGSVGADS